MSDSNGVQRRSSIGIDYSRGEEGAKGSMGKLGERTKDPKSARKFKIKR